MCQSVRVGVRHVCACVCVSVLVFVQIYHLIIPFPVCVRVQGYLCVSVSISGACVLCSQPLGVRAWVSPDDDCGQSRNPGYIALCSLAIIDNSRCEDAWGHHGPHWERALLERE